VDSQTYEVAGLRVEVRTNSGPFGEWLRTVLARYTRAQASATSDYSVFVGPTAGRSQRNYHLLYRGFSPVVRTTDLHTLARALLAELESLLFAGRRDAVYLRAARVCTNGVTALVPAPQVMELVGLGRQVERAGIRLPAELTTAIDLGGGELVTVRPLLEIEGAAPLGDLPVQSQADASERPAGSESIGVVCLAGAWEAPGPAPLSRGMALHGLAALVANLPAVGGTGLAALGRVVAGARCSTISGGSPRSVLATLSAALGSVSP